MPEQLLEHLKGNAGHGLMGGAGMPQIMQPALQARPGGRFMEGVRHGIDLPQRLYKVLS